MNELKGKRFEIIPVNDLNLIFQWMECEWIAKRSAKKKQTLRVRTRNKKNKRNKNN